VVPLVARTVYICVGASVCVAVAVLPLSKRSQGSFVGEDLGTHDMNQQRCGVCAHVCVVVTVVCLHDSFCRLVLIINNSTLRHIPQKIYSLWRVACGLMCVRVCMSTCVCI